MPAADLGEVMRGKNINRSQEHFIGDALRAIQPTFEVVGAYLQLSTQGLKPADDLSGPLQRPDIHGCQTSPLPQGAWIYQNVRFSPSGQ